MNYGNMGECMDVMYLIRDLLRRRNLQEWMNARFKEDRAVVLDRTDIACITTFSGDHFLMTPDVHSATSVFWRYRFNDIRKTDKVIDLGANVGGFAICATHFTDNTIIALEPVRFDILMRNIVLNSVHTKVIPICGAIADSDFIDVTWREASSRVPGKTFSEILRLAGGCDFLKMDIEGGEWTITPDELDGIRRIEGQLHFPYKGFKHPLLDYIEENYYVEYSPNTPPETRPCLPQYTPYELNPVFHAERKD